MSHSNDQLAVQVLEAIRQISALYGQWFAETVHQFGLEKALDAETRAGDQITALALKRLGDGFNPFADWDRERLEALLDALARVWMSVDGLWFQAVEGASGLDGAKRVNDTCWCRNAPLEARRAKAVLGLGETPGLEGLAAALRLRLHFRVMGTQIVPDDPDALIVKVVDCRVQTARRRKGLKDYPCKSGGTEEFTGFARAVDRRIRTRCLTCPPDPAVPDAVCAWRFTLEKA